MYYGAVEANEYNKQQGKKGQFFHVFSPTLYLKA